MFYDSADVHEFYGSQNQMCFYFLFMSNKAISIASVVSMARWHGPAGRREYRVIMSYFVN